MNDIYEACLFTSQSNYSWKSVYNKQSLAPFQFNEATGWEQSQISDNWVR